MTEKEPRERRKTMKKLHMVRFLSAAAVVCLLSSVVGVTYAWQSGSQTVKNEFSGETEKRFDVELEKLEKSPDGTETETPLSGAAFYLFQIFEDGEEAAERQIGVRYLTDEDGKITLSLPKGSYCFLENAPPSGYGYDTDENGKEIKKYPFDVTGSETEAVRITAYNVPAFGALSLSKTVKNITGTPLTDEQKAEKFTFRVSFSDGGEYDYLLHGERKSLKSGETLMLSHGEEALFENIPDGVVYTVTETDLSGMIPTVITKSGEITEGETAKAAFINYAPESERDLTLRITKRVEGDLPESERDRAFEFILTVNGEKRTISLKNGETSDDFVIPYGATYTLEEADYSRDGYRSNLTAQGTVTNDRTLIEAEAVNTYVKKTVDISGEKTWETGESDENLPESITVVLKNGTLSVMKATVKPDEDGRWRYSFTAPRFDDEGNEIEYSVKEMPVERYRAVYAGFDIKNVYVPPVTAALPAVTKTVDGENAPTDARFEFLLRGEGGAPMPEESEEGVFTLTRYGAGNAEFPPITFDRAGVYSYTVSELDRGESGWVYDTARYTLTVTVTLTDGALRAETAIEKDGEEADAVVFLNQFRNGATDSTAPTDATAATEVTEPTAATTPTEATEPTAATEATESTTSTEVSEPTEIIRPPETNEATESTAATTPTGTAATTPTDAAASESGTSTTPPAATSGGSSQSGGGSSQQSGNSKTGDSRNLLPWLVLMGLSLTVIGVHTVLFIRYKKRKEYVGKYFRK